MTAKSDFGAAKILCVERDVVVLENRCSMLKNSGYDAASASPQVAEIALRRQRFDLIILSSLTDSDLHRVINLADGADELVLDEFTMPSELLSLVEQRLNRHQQRASRHT
jgi:DNA-binding response OmpR family regulator